MGFFWALLFALILVLLLVLTIVGLPGNWLMVAAASMYALATPTESNWSIGWPVVISLVVLATLAELCEWLAGALGVTRAGGSRRSAALAVIGSVIGGVGGMVVGAPFSLLGSLVAAVLGSSLGAFAGAVVGEDWRGRRIHESTRVGWAAFLSRLLGTLTKSAIGGLMVLVAVVALFIV